MSSNSLSQEDQPSSQSITEDAPCTSAEIDFDFSKCFNDFDEQEQSEDKDSPQSQANKLMSFNLAKEIEQYMSYKSIEKSSSPFKFWKMFSGSLKLLSSLSKKYLCSPPSSVESERLFSCGGQIYSPKRNRLNADTGEKLMFSHFNLILQKLD